MAYEKTNWVDNETPINAANLNKMEDGIVEASKTGGVLDGTIVEWEEDEIPEGYEEVEKDIINSTEITDKENKTYSAEIIDGLVKEVYSTEEQVVGTYLGKTLYRKVIVQNLTKANETISVGHSITKVEGIIESKYANGWLIPNHPYNSSNKDAYFCDLFISAGNIYLELGSSLYGSATTQANIKLTVEYTKTTD